MRIDTVTNPRGLYKSQVKKHTFLLSTKSNEVKLLFSKECNELLAIRHLILNVPVPLQLLVTAS
jgi:hypothetical protein